MGVYDRLRRGLDEGRNLIPDASDDEAALIERVCALVLQDEMCPKCGEPMDEHRLYRVTPDPTPFPMCPPAPMSG